MKPTPYPEVNQLLLGLKKHAREILGRQFVGMYLHGSLSSGDFDPASSDVDFIIVTDGKLDTVTVERLKLLHDEIKTWDSPWREHLEGCYITTAQLRRYTPHQKVPHLNEYGFEIRELGPDWVIQRAIIRDKGVVVAGPDPRTLIDPVSKGQVKAAVISILVDFWSKSIEDPSWLKPKMYQAFAALTMCRALYVLKYGEVISKPKAAEWALSQYPEWEPLIRWALASRADKQAANPSEALKFIAFTIETARQAQGTSQAV